MKLACSLFIRTVTIRAWCLHRRDCMFDYGLLVQVWINLYCKFLSLALDISCYFFCPSLTLCSLCLWLNGYSCCVDRGRTGVRLSNCVIRGLTGAWWPPRYIQEPLLVRYRDGRPPGRPLAVHCFCICSSSALLEDLLVINKSVECDFLCVMSCAMFFSSVSIMMYHFFY